jgi:RND family efflux transporter MFP subunit
MCAVRSWVALLPLFALLGCRPASEPPSPKPPEVTIGRAVVKEVTDFEDFTGRIESPGSVDIRARVSGYLKEVFFKEREGAEVKQGEPLFQIDPDTYQADLDRAKAALDQAIVHHNRLKKDYQRAAVLLPGRSISQEEFDKIESDRDEAEAAIGTARAALKLAELNRGYTTVVSPINGWIGRRMIDPGNMVKADDTVLTTVVSLEPIYAYFDVDERTMLRVRRLIRSGKVKSSREATRPVYVGLADEVDENGSPRFPHEGVINFVDPRIDAMAGTLRLRCEIPNKDRMFSPGMFVRVRLPIGTPHRAVLISERALASDQGQSYVYVINEKDEVASRGVKVGAIHEGLRVVEGLEKDERIVVSGLQRVRPGVKVTPVPEKAPVESGASKSPGKDGTSKPQEATVPSQASSVRPSS